MSLFCVQGAGIPYTVTYLPDERAIQSIITGQYDALDLRIGQLDNEAGLVKVCSARANQSTLICQRWKLLPNTR